MKLLWQQKYCDQAFRHRTRGEQEFRLRFQGSINHLRILKCANNAQGIILGRQN